MSLRPVASGTCKEYLARVASTEGIAGFLH